MGIFAQHVRRCGLTQSPSYRLIRFLETRRTERRDETPDIDAEDGSPVLDIKPYSLAWIASGRAVPEWCRHLACRL